MEVLKCPSRDVGLENGADTVTEVHHTHHRSSMLLEHDGGCGVGDNGEETESHPSEENDRSSRYEGLGEGGQKVEHRRSHVSSTINPLEVHAIQQEGRDETSQDVGEAQTGGKNAVLIIGSVEVGFHNSEADTSHILHDPHGKHGHVDSCNCEPILSVMRQFHWKGQNKNMR